MRLPTPRPSVLAASFALLVCLITGSPSSALGADANPEPALVMHRGVFERLIKAYNRNAPVAVVRFMTRLTVRDVTYADGRSELGVLWPETGFEHTDRINLEGIAVRMDGRFFLVKELQHNAPPLGAVKKTIPLRSRRSDDPFQHRLWPFAEASERGQAVMALAVFNSGATRVLDAQLIAPLGNGDIPLFENFIEHLRNRPLEKITVHEAEGLLDSPNQLFAWLGLTRLEKLNMLGARHYYRAILAIDPQTSSNLLSEMVFRPGQHGSPKQELLDHLALLLKNPKKQAEVAKFLYNRFAPNAQAQRGLAEVEQLQQLTKDYRDQNLDVLQTRPDALAEIEKFIAWRARP